MRTVIKEHSHNSTTQCLCEWLHAPLYYLVSVPVPETQDLEAQRQLSSPISCQEMARY